jgi:hypothetical protein
MEWQCDFEVMRRWQRQDNTIKHGDGDGCAKVNISDVSFLLAGVSRRRAKFLHFKKRAK